MACVVLFLPAFAEPPAESPSTINSSDFAGSRSEQSASFPGNPPPERTDFLTVSLAFLAASRARAALTAFSMMTLAVEGFSSKYFCNPSYTTDPTTPSISVFTNLDLV